jgi:hypothetical protein
MGPRLAMDPFWAPPLLGPICNLDLFVTVPTPLPAP